MNVNSPVFIPNLIVENSTMNSLLYLPNNKLVRRTDNVGAGIGNTTTIPSIIGELDKMRQQKSSTKIQQYNYNYYDQARSYNWMNRNYMSASYQVKEHGSKLFEHIAIEQNLLQKHRFSLNENVVKKSFQFRQEFKSEIKQEEKPVQKTLYSKGKKVEFWQLPLKEQLLHQLNSLQEDTLEQERTQKQEMYQSLQQQFWNQLSPQYEYDDTVQHNSSKVGHKTNEITKFNHNNTKSSAKGSRTSVDNNNKRTNYKNKNHHHSHPWLASNLKGHTDEIRDIDFSSNGKFLASCAEDNSNNTSNTTESDQHHDNQPHRGIIRHHNNGHRNSTTSSSSSSTDSTAGSGTDDINCSSSNEDISIHMYLPSKPSSLKKSSKSGRNRQRQRQRQLKIINCNHIRTTMEIDDELKENRNPLQQSSTNNKILSTGTGSTITTTRKQYKQSSTSLIPSTSPLKSVNLSKQQNYHHPTSKVSKIEEIVNMNRKIISSPLIFNMDESDLVKFLRYYVIDPNLLRIYGYPVESIYHDGSIEIFKCLSRPFTHYKTNGKYKKRCRTVNKTLTNSNCGNIINENDGLTWSSSKLSRSSDSSSSSSSSSSSGRKTSSPRDSGQGDSGSSSPPSVIDSDTSETSEEDFTTTFYTPDGNYQIFSNYNQFGEKQCARCNRNFILSDDGEYLTTEECNYHWGRPYQVYVSGQGITNFVNCCNREQSSFGCCHNYVHVWAGITVGINGPFNDYVQTKKNYLKLDDKQPKNKRFDIENLRKHKVYAIDCEMCFTAMGLDVGKVTIIGIDGKLAYEQYIRPDMKIVDYNTRFSGIKENDLSLDNPNVKTLKEVQNELLQFINSDTILIGHALDNDLRALKILHKNVIDTSITFPHMSGFPYRRALKHLTKNCLGRDIQTGEYGHCSFEDSQACLELILWRVQKDLELASD